MYWAGEQRMNYIINQTCATASYEYSFNGEIHHLLLSPMRFLRKKAINCMN